jgi:hypothetical protein
MAAADRIGQAFGATDTTSLLDGGDGGYGGTVEVDTAPVQQSRVMVAEQKINIELEAARAALQQLTRLQAAAQEVRLPLVWEQVASSCGHMDHPVPLTGPAERRVGVLVRWQVQQACSTHVLNRRQLLGRLFGLATSVRLCLRAALCASCVAHVPC